MTPNEALDWLEKNVTRINIIEPPDSHIGTGWEIYFNDSKLASDYVSGNTLISAIECAERMLRK